MFPSRQLFITNYYWVIWSLVAGKFAQYITIQLLNNLPDIKNIIMFLNDIYCLINTNTRSVDLISDFEEHHLVNKGDIEPLEFKETWENSYPT